MGVFRFSEDPSCKMNMRHGYFAVLFPGKKWLFKYFCFIYKAFSTAKVEAMTFRYFSHSRSTLKADNYYLNILKTPHILQKLPFSNIIGSEDCLKYSLRNSPNF
jgi:hypothetical protein